MKINKNMWSNLKQDIRRYRYNNRIDWSEPSIPVVVLYRFGRYAQRNRFKVIRILLKMIHLPFFIFFTLLTGIHIPRSCQIGAGLRIYHFGCLIINPGTVIGKDCTLRHGVTIGTRIEDNDAPVLGDNVDIGAGAKILGRIRIGNNVSIGANAVVITDIPDDCIAVGVPAKAIPKKVNRPTSEG
jgi:serine O-acetyltransferase